MIDWQTQEKNDGGDFLATVKEDLFKDRVYVFTPKGDVIDLPAGSTPIDFAYHVHTEIGHRCRGARVNNQLVSLDYQLQNGDQVEIITAKRGGPSRDWLNPHLGYVKTSRARTKIRQWFRQQNRDENITAGRELLERELNRLGVDNITYEHIGQLFGKEKVDDLLAGHRHRRHHDGAGGDARAADRQGRRAAQARRPRSWRRTGAAAEAGHRGAGHRRAGRGQSADRPFALLQSDAARRYRRLRHPWAWRFDPPPRVPERARRSRTASG